MIAATAPPTVTTIATAITPATTATKKATAITTRSKRQTTARVTTATGYSHSNSKPQRHQQPQQQQAYLCPPSPHSNNHNQPAATIATTKMVVVLTDGCVGMVVSARAAQRARGRAAGRAGGSGGEEDGRPASRTGREEAGRGPAWATPERPTGAADGVAALGGRKPVESVPSRSRSRRRRFVNAGLKKKNLNFHCRRVYGFRVHPLRRHYGATTPPTMLPAPGLHDYFTTTLWAQIRTCAVLPPTARAEGVLVFLIIAFVRQDFRKCRRRRRPFA